ncbi:pyridoxamine 5'-phosphate oxidase family protein [Mucilaginibacter sp. L3T2-6]|nr:pyridoxamine 5'-phosphate oxidase family protein [Mucilaginibacter sp. L3T2-6]MDV6215207.1 pyridoxamine 5'-phosphate oxidase family protein [Mucilaginibacter sp. L3T2-6]
MCITNDMLPAMQSVVPSTMATVSADGIPNLTYISQVFYVDDNHVAISFQYMNKSWKNINENPNITMILTHPVTIKMWKMNLVFEEIKYDGPVFDNMDMQLTAIASMYGMADRFKLKAALICRATDITVLYDGGL